MAENSNQTVGTITTRVLFCGLTVPSSVEYTKQYLLPYPFIQVDAMAFDKVPDVIANYDICVVRGMKLDANVISLARQMKLIVQFGVGLEGVDIEAATKFGIKVARIPGNTSGNSLSCAEHAIYLILGLLRDQKGMEKAFKERMLGVPTGETLYGKTVFIVGYGNIGKDLAIRLRPFGVKILATRRRWHSKSALDLSKQDAVDNYPLQSIDNGNIKDDLIDEKGGNECLYEFAKQADIVVTCATLTSETVGMVNAKFLSSMKKVFIVGYGNIGKDLAIRLRPFGVKILATRRRWHSKSALDLSKQDAVDNYPMQSIDNGNIKDDLIDEKGGNERLYEFAKQADIVVTCATLTSETVGMVNAKFLSSMKKGAFLVNVARGGLLDYEAVKASLECGHLGGLGTDVAWFEPFDPADPIIQHPKFLITPHVAGVTEVSYRNMAKVIGDCALHLNNGESFIGIEIVN